MLITQKKSLTCLAAAFALSASVCGLNAQNVDPIIGTNGMGHTFPGACYPFGIVQLSPDTDTIPQNIDGVYQKRVYEYCAGYQHGDSTIVGFSHTHFSGTGHSDLGDILVMPGNGKVVLNPGTSWNRGYRSLISHDTEHAEPGYYSVRLEDPAVKAEMTATARAGVHRYTFDSPDNPHIVLDLNHGIYNYEGKTLWAYVRVENDSTVTGYRITNGWARTNYTYFAMRFSKPVKEYGYKESIKSDYTGFWRKFDNFHNFPEMAARGLAAYFTFDLEDDPQLEVKVALSAVSTEGALKNLEAETAGKSFDEIASAAREEWARELDIIEAQGDSDKLDMLYTSLYHTMINPSVYMDVDGSYRGLDHNIHKADGFTNYTIFSLWDTYRALHPLLNILSPDRNRDMVNSLLAHYSQSVHKALPVWSHMGNENWCMIGYHAVSLLSDAYACGLDFDYDKALEAMVSSSRLSYYDGIGEYMRLGYVPYDASSSAVSMTLEYSYDDWAIAKMAESMGREDIAKEYYRRAESFNNVFDSSLGFARARYADGSWKEDFSLLNTHGEGFIEGNSWNYSFYVPHDVNRLISLMGGDRRFVERLDSLFTMELPEEFFANTEDVTKEGLIGNYVHGNEPSHHVPYLYAWTSQPWKAQPLIRKIMNTKYRNTIDGLCGNDDCGQMSAWYIFSAMGFYPVLPGSGQYVFGAPYLPYMKVRLGNGNVLEIKAPKVSDRNCYVKSIILNGKKIERMFITYDEIMAGGVLEYEMASRPEKRMAQYAKPYSME